VTPALSLSKGCRVVGGEALGPAIVGGQVSEATVSPWACPQEKFVR